MKNFDEFYPTPKELLEKITEGCKWSEIFTVLEPSAGKGDIVEFLQEKGKLHYKEYDIDCIESEPELQMILKGKNMRVVYDDFLTYDTRKQYDLIIMNPPFSNGDEHLLKALELQKRGGNIICILNAETIRNPFTNRRKDLNDKLEQYHAEISFLEQAFSDAERKTSVEIAVVKVSIPKEPGFSFIFEEMKKAKLEKEIEAERMTDVAENDFIKAIVKRCEIEIDACLAFVREYKGLKPYIMREVKENSWNKPILSLRLNDHEFEDGDENKLLCAIRKKYWKALFADPRFTGKMTSEQREDYMGQVETLKDYDFNMYNIKSIQLQMSKNLIAGIEECIMKLFDKLSHEHSYLPETGRNIHYYNGWCTNKAHLINKKVILPMNTYNKILEGFRCFYVQEELADMEKVFDYLAGIPSHENRDIYRILNHAEQTQQTKNVECRYFTLTFYKKGTCHIVFKDEELLKKFNIFGSRKKGWLPPSYGKKAYENMTPEEKQVIDAFEGEVSYRAVMNHPEQYLLDLEAYIPKLEEKTA